MRSLLCSLFTVAQLFTFGQVSNITCTSEAAELAMKGLHDPAQYAASEVIDDHEVILCELRTAVAADSLKAHLQGLLRFYTRHTRSDTVSETSGIGAARRWIHGKFAEFSAANEDRLIPGYVQFDYQAGANECGSGAAWKNVLAVLPGSDVSDHRVVLIEAHMDSRCADNCDSTCYAPGAEDNGSGVALVMELARVLTKYTFKHTLVFLLTTGEEHGLLGAEAMATYCTTQNIALKAVQNNDVIGGVLCGATASPPSCSPAGDVDSLQVRLFSSGSTALPHRGFARTIKMYYDEKMSNQVHVPMTISVMNSEDRGERGGDHIPFRIEGFRNVRFTAANEHGDGDPSGPGYADHQHTSDDILGVDTDGDQEVDSFFVDFNYLQRNAVINGTSMTLLALGPETPTFDVLDEPTGLRVVITGNASLPWYRIGVRDNSAATEFEALYRTDETSFPIPGLTAANAYFISVAGIDSAGIMSPFSGELTKVNDVGTPPGTMDDLPFGLACAPISIAEQLDPNTTLQLLPCKPNPFADRTVIPIQNYSMKRFGKAAIVINDMHGKELMKIPFVLERGLNEVHYNHRSSPGLFQYGLMVDGHRVGTRKLVVLP